MVATCWFSTVDSVNSILYLSLTLTEENPFLLLDKLECIHKCKIDEYLKKCIRIYFKDVNDAAKNIIAQRK